MEAKVYGLPLMKNHVNSNDTLVEIREVLVSGNVSRPLETASFLGLRTVLAQAKNMDLLDTLHGHRGRSDAVRKYHTIEQQSSEGEAQTQLDKRHKRVNAGGRELSSGTQSIDKSGIAV